MMLLVVLYALLLAPVAVGIIKGIVYLIHKL